MDKRASLCSPNKGQCLCLVQAWTQLETPSSSEGAVDVTQEPAELKTGPETSVPSGTSPPWGVGNSCRGALETLRGC